MAAKREEFTDFGFSLVDEDELRSLERELAAQNQVVSAEAQNYKDKFDTLYDMITVLLQNLSKKPNKSYIFWPNRIEKVREFKTRIDELASKDS